MSDIEAKTFEFDEFRLESAERRLFRGDEEKRIAPKAFDVLLVLLERPGQLVSKDDIYDRVWPDTIVEEANLTVQISSLRKAIGSEKIETVKGHGYRFKPEVLLLEDQVKEISIEERTVQRLTIEHELDEQFATATGQTISPGVMTTEGRPQEQPYSRARLLAVTLTATLLVVAIAVGNALWRGGNGPASNLKVAEIRRLTTKGDVTVAALAPDGRFYVYSVAEEEGESLWLGHIGGGNPVLLRNASPQRYLAITFSKQGEHFYYVTQETATGKRIFRRSTVFGPISETVIENVDAPFAISPDESSIAYVRASEGRGVSELVVLDLGDRNEAILASRPWNLGFSRGGISWSPDGKVLAFAAITDERSVVYEILGINLADGRMFPLSSEKWNEVFKLEWQHDGKGVFLIGSDINGWYWSQIWHISHPRGESRRITLDFHSYLSSSLSVSADGSAILAVQHEQLNGIWVGPAAESERATQTSNYIPGRYEGLFGLSWTTDGHLIYGAYVGKDQTIWTMDADGSNNRQIISGGYNDSLPVASLDGAHLVFHSNRTKTFEIWRTGLDGSDLRQITSDSQNYQPTISPDGKWVIYRSWKDGKGCLWKISTDGGEPVRFTNYAASWPQFSPDGTRVAYAATDRKIEIADSLTGQILLTFKMPDGAMPWNGIRWFPDGNAITIRDSKQGIWRIDIADPAVPYKIEGIGSKKIYNFAWSPDGKKLALTKGTETDDVVLIIASF